MGCNPSRHVGLDYEQCSLSGVGAGGSPTRCWPFVFRSHVTNLSGILVASVCILPPTGLREERAIVLFVVCAREPTSFVSGGNPSQ
jgi:hypothetical protein